MKKSMLCALIVLLFSCYSMIHASENIIQDDSKDDNEITGTPQAILISGDNEITRTPPVILKSVEPVFPEKAKEDYVEGIVILRCILTKNGDVEDCKVEQAVPPDYFETSAIDATKKYKFKPATINGEPVDVIIMVPMIFTYYGSPFTKDASIALEAYTHAGSGIGLIKIAEYKKAVDELSEAIKLHSRYPLAYYYRSLAYMKMEEYEKAIPDIDRAIKLDRKVYGFYNHRGSIYLFMKDYQKAIKDFNKSIKIETKNIVAYIHRGDAYRESEKYQQAIEDYTSALSFDENLIHVHNNRGYTYLKLNDNNNACGDFKRTCELGDCRGLEYLQKKGTCASEGPVSGD